MHLKKEHYDEDYARYPIVRASLYVYRVSLKCSRLPFDNILTCGIAIFVNSLPPKKL